MPTLERRQGIIVALNPTPDQPDRVRPVFIPEGVNNPYISGDRNYTGNPELTACRTFAHKVRWGRDQVKKWKSRSSLDPKRDEKLKLWEAFYAQALADQPYVEALLNNQPVDRLLVQSENTRQLNRPLETEPTPGWDREPEPLPSLRPEEGLSESEDDDDFISPDTDRRELVFRQIRERRGQSSFRDSLLLRFGGRCLVTGCDVIDVLEAAHISPYRGEEDNHLSNGLLLRADIHTLFDLDLLGIEPNKFQLKTHPRIAQEYGRFNYKLLVFSDQNRPSRNALERRYKRFVERVASDQKSPE